MGPENILGDELLENKKKTDTENVDDKYLTKDDIGIDPDILSQITQTIIPELINIFVTEKIDDPQKSLMQMVNFITMGEKILVSIDQSAIQKGFGSCFSQEKNIDPNLQISDRHNLNHDFFRIIDRNKVFDLINFNLPWVCDFYKDNYVYQPTSPYIMDFDMFISNLNKSISTVKEFINVFKMCPKL